MRHMLLGSSKKRKAVRYETRTKSYSINGVEIYAKAKYPSNIYPFIPTDNLAPFTVFHDGASEGIPANAQCVVNFAYPGQKVYTFTGTALLKARYYNLRVNSDASLHMWEATLQNGYTWGPVSENIPSYVRIYINYTWQEAIVEEIED
ncbi:hypothetical protein CHL10074_07075 [Campylobacter hyointestinalis subsp. lawsonii]|nr:hypothetical protein CHL10074_07075 [Campylobacter hyointestinalis subsp. lawsonii]RAZ62905.1 hypothetical protein CHL9767_07780 [Campylobacter hyointestinalis subsp. lawsonii]